MSKRITIAVTNDLSMDQRVHRVATSLLAAGWDVLVVGRQLPDSATLSPRAYATHRMRLKVIRGKWFYFWFNYRLFFFLLRQAPDVVYANDMDTLPAAWLAARIRRKKIVYDSHELWTEIPELVRRPRTRAIWLWLEKRLVPKVDLAFTVNQSIADIYQDLYHIKVTAFRNLPVRLHQRLERTAPGHLLWYQGALNEGRGLELMIRSMQHLPAEYRLGIAGEGPMKGELSDMVQDLGLQNRVTLHGHISIENLPSYTQKAALGLSLEEAYSKSYQLATPNKLFDYMQSGIPVLVSSLPEMKRIVTDNGVGEVLAEEEREPEEVAKRIRAIVEDAVQWQAYRQKCLEAAAELCWEKESELLLKAMEALS